MTQNKYNKGDQVQIANGDWFEYECYISGGLHNLLGKEGQRYTVTANLITNHRPAVDWGTVKAGAAFNSEDTTYIFIGNDPTDKEFALFWNKRKGQMYKSNLEFVRKELVTRHPEGDIKEEV